MSRVRVSVRPRIFLYAKKTPNYCKSRVARALFISMSRHCLASVGKGAPNHDEQRRSWVGVCVSVGERTSVHACVRDVFAIYDDNIFPRLIMIIIKIIFLYFIQIRHTDDFPSTGISLIPFAPIY